MRSATAIAVVVGVVIGGGAVMFVTGTPVSELVNDSQNLTTNVTGGLDVNRSSPVEPYNEVTAVPQANFSVTAVQARFVELLNTEREGQNLLAVQSRPQLRRLAVSHSQAMRDAGEVAHEGVGDGTVTGRFENWGLLPECRVPIQGSDQYYPGIENVAGAWVGQQMNAPWADGGSVTIRTNDQLARALFDIWMQSDRHREAMLTDRVESIGLGFVITDEERVFAALEMCGAAYG